MSAEDELRELTQTLRGISNRQVEFIDRIRQIEERGEALMDRMLKCERQLAALERSPSRSSHPS
jgi:chromosome segregation ATPase